MIEYQDLLNTLSSMYPIVQYKGGDMRRTSIDFDKTTGEVIVLQVMHIGKDAKTGRDQQISQIVRLSPAEVQTIYHMVGAKTVGDVP